jgi:hypothetical protein
MKTAQWWCAVVVVLVVSCAASPAFYACFVLVWSMWSMRAIYNLFQPGGATLEQQTITWANARARVASKKDVHAAVVLVADHPCQVPPRGQSADKTLYLNVFEKARLHDAWWLEWLDKELAAGNLTHAEAAAGRTVLHAQISLYNLTVLA